MQNLVQRFIQCVFFKKWRERLQENLMSRKKKDNAKQGTYALCITMGIVLGFGLGAIFEQLLITTLVGAVAGFLAANKLTR